jgi:hypothetical protein
VIGIIPYVEEDVRQSLYENAILCRTARKVAFSAIPDQDL